MADDDQAVLDTETEEQAPTARPIFQPEEQPSEQPTAVTARPVFQPAVTTRPVFQPAARDRAQDQAPSPEATAVATDIANQYAAQTPAIPREEYGPAPRAYTLPELAARATAEQYGADFAVRAHTRAQLVAQDEANRFAAEKQAREAQQQGATAAAQAGQQSFIDHYATAHVNNPVNLASMGADLFKKGLGNFEALFNTARQGVDTDDLMINKAVDEMLPDGSPEDKAAFKGAFIAGNPNQRSQWLSALLPYTTGMDTAALSDALDRKSDPALQAAKAQDLADSQARARANLEGDPRLQGTNVGKIISQVAALPAYAAAANPLIAPVGIPMIFGRIFADTREQLKQENPDWTDEQLDKAAANTAIIQTVGAEAGNRIISGGLLGPLLKNIRGGYLARAAVQVPATAAAQAAVGAGTQAATNIAQGRPVGESVVEAALGQGIVGGAAGAIHARVRPPLPPETAAPPPEAAAVPAPAPAEAAPAPEVTTGPTGARLRGPEERTMQQGAQAAAAAPPPVPAEQPPVVQTPAQRAAAIGPGEFTVMTPEEAQAAGVVELGRVAVPQNVPRETPVEAVPTEAAPVQLVTGFTTAKGSTYEVHDDGTTTRTKAARAEHPGEVGLQPQSERTVYLVPEDADRLAPPQGSVRFVDHGDGTISLVTPTAEGGWGVSPSARKVPYSEIPTVGSIPLELSDTSKGIGYRASHFGNEITEVRTGAATAPETQLAEKLRPFGLTVDQFNTWVEARRRRSEDFYYKYTPEEQAVRAQVHGLTRAQVEALVDLAGDRPVPAEAVTPVRPPPAEHAPVTEDEPWVSTIANRFVGPRVEAGEIGEVAPGQGYSTQDLVNLGRRMPPETVAQHVSNLVNDVGGDPKLQAAAVRYEEARLSERSRQLSRVAEANPHDKQAQIDAKEAFDNLTDFHKGAIAKLKNNWHAQGMAMQGELPVDLTTFNGLREQWLRDVGKPPPADAEPTLRKTARRVKTAVDAEAAAMKNLGNEIDKTPKRAISVDELANAIAEQMGNLPCVRV